MFHSYGSKLLQCFNPYNATITNFDVCSNKLLKLSKPIIFIFLSGNLLVVGGYHLEDYINHTGGIYGNSTVIPGNKGVQANLTHIWSKNISCDALEDTKELVIGATGGVIQNRPLICGGLDIYGNISRSCYELGPKGTQKDNV